MIGICIAFLILFLAIGATEALLLKIDSLSPGKLTNCELGGLAFLLAPVFISLLLWCGMFFFPGKISAAGYVGGISGLFILICLLQLRPLLRWSKDVWREILIFCARENISKKCLYLGGFLLLLLWVTLAAWAWLNPVRNFDVIEYILGGDFFASMKSIVYHGLFINPANGFWYYTYHSFCLPLFAAWGCFLHELLNVPQDWYFKFICLYYLAGLNLIALLFMVRLKTAACTLPVMVCAFLLLNCVPVTYDFVFFYGCDFFRVSLLTSFFLLLWLYQREPQWSICIFAGFAGAAATAAHGLSVIFCILLCFSVFFVKTDWKRKSLQIALLGGIILLFSGSHYILQSISGDGWLFQMETYFPGIYNIAERFPSLFHLIMYGYLGQLFGIKMFFFNLLFLLLFASAVIYYRKLKPGTMMHWSFFCSLGAIWLLIAVKLFYNFRYQYTLYPLLLLLMFGMFVAYGLSRREQKILYCFTVFSLLFSFAALLHCAVAFFCSQTLQNPQTIPVAVEETPQKKASSEMLWRYFAKNNSQVLVIAQNKIYFRETLSPFSYADCYPTSVMTHSGKIVNHLFLAEKFNYMLVNRSYKEKYPHRIQINMDDWKPIVQNERDILYVSKKYKEMKKK